MRSLEMKWLLAFVPPPGGRALTDLSSTLLLIGVLVLGFWVSMRLVAWVLVHLDLAQLLRELGEELRSPDLDRTGLPDPVPSPAALGSRMPIAFKVVREYWLTDCPCLSALCSEGKCCCYSEVFPHRIAESTRNVWHGRLNRKTSRRKATRARRAQRNRGHVATAPMPSRWCVAASSANPATT